MLHDVVQGVGFSGIEFIGVNVAVVVNIVRERVGSDQHEVDRVLRGVAHGLQIVAHRAPADVATGAA
jgi:hypothetical protein